MVFLESDDFLDSFLVEGGEESEDELVLFSDDLEESEVSEDLEESEDWESPELSFFLSSTGIFVIGLVKSGTFED